MVSIADKLTEYGRCGEITQVAHISTLGHLSHLFKVVYLCDVSNGALVHCQEKVPGRIPPKITRSAEELCASPDVDLVLIASSDAFHTPHALVALMHNKHVFVEKPMALSLKDVDSIIEAERTSKGKLVVGYMRRYAAGFIDALNEIGSIDEIRYARVRDIVGPNSTFVEQSGTWPQAFRDYTASDSKALAAATDSLLQQALTVELGIPVNPSTSIMWRHLGSLGSHDLSAMRELLGMPSEVLGASLCQSSGPPFWW